jgi:hypothetical protein
MATLTKGKTFISGETVTPAKLHELVDQGTVTNIVDADVSASAAIAFSKLAPLDGANILVGNGSNVATKVAVTGDVTISNAGVTAIGAAKVLPTMLAQKFTLDTAKASTSGTSIDFTGIPSWAKRVTVMFSGVSTNGTSPLLIQIGDAGGIEITGYESGAGLAATAGTFGSSAIGFLVEPTVNLSAATLRFGSMIISTLGSNIWVEQLGVYTTTAGTEINGAGGKTLSDTLTQVRITTVNGTDTFDAGTINISYEG